MTLRPCPINFAKWIEENGDRLQPPVNNFLLARDGFIVMAVGGPNARTDYHVNPTEEWFYQYRGDMLLKVVAINAATQQEEFMDVPIREGEMLLLPANTPHNPCRYADTVGLVLERERPIGQLDRLRWYCERCRLIVFEEAFQCTDLGTQLKPVIEKYAQTPELRTCKCGHVNSHK
eukprot:Partr_v1_DN23654_c1_g1_i1_m19089 putative Catalyzes the oxidative ring opening of 3- hydroxyanthranilate to 2-amino-3-carboxymuconate semialdehyde, which spontaneously cyclizes to quinolinate (By similarity)